MGFPMALPIGTKLKGGQYPYTIEEVLGQGSYGITYKVSTEFKVENIPVQQAFAVKECFTKKYCSRYADGVTMSYPKELSEDIEKDIQDFLSEGKKLREICKKSKNIVKVNETWQENGTAYYAMGYIKGGNLYDYVKCNGCLSEKEALNIISPIIDAVELVHQHRMLHLDIKPENIMLEEQKNGTIIPILIDFGISLHFNQNGEKTNTSKEHSVGCSDGYAPLEQYSGVNYFAPEFDIYALGASLYYMLVGKDPKKASEINAKQIESALPQDVSDRTKNTVIHAMNKFVDERIKTAKAFKNELYSTKDNQDPYKLKIRYFGEGEILLNNTVLQNGATYHYMYDSQETPTITIIPDGGYKVLFVRLNNNDITSRLDGNTLKLTRQDKEIDLSVSFDKINTVKYKEYTSNKSTGNGKITNGLLNVIGSLKRNRSIFFSLLATCVMLFAGFLYGRNIVYEQRGSENYAVAKQFLERKDTVSAIPYLEKSIEYGNSTAMAEIGECYLTGNGGVEKDTIKAFHFFELAESNSEPKGQERLGYCYENGYGIEKDSIKAYNLYKLSAEQGYCEGMYRLGVCFVEGIGVKKDTITAFSWYKRSAEAGSGNGMHKVADCLLWGEGTQVDTVEAIKWYNKSVELNNKYAQYHLGWCYNHGTGVKRDSVKAFNLLLLSAQQGYVEAMDDIAYRYSVGDGTKKDERQAFLWYMNMAKLNNLKGIYKVGISYRDGKGVTKDSTKAWEWIHKAAELGYDDAQNALGDMYFDNKKYKEAVKWYIKASDQNERSSQCSLGFCYFFGWGVESDTVKAVRFWEESLKPIDYGTYQIRKENTGAMHNLGVCYENGWGVKKDLKKSNYWYNRERGIESDSISTIKDNKNIGSQPKRKSPQKRSHQKEETNYSNVNFDDL